MKSFWQKNRESIIIIVFILLAAALVWFGVLPGYRNIQAKMVKVQETLADGEIRRERARQLPELRQLAEKIQSDTDSFDVILDKDAVLSLVETIESVGRETGTTVKIETSTLDALPLSKGKAKPKNPPAETPLATEGDKKPEEIPTLQNTLPSEKYIVLTLTVVGKYENIVAFVRKIENMSHYADILSLQIQPSEPSEDAHAASVNNPFTGALAVGTPALETLPIQPKAPEGLTAKFQVVVYTLEN